MKSCRVGTSRQAQWASGMGAPMKAIFASSIPHRSQIMMSYWRLRALVCSSGFMVASPHRGQRVYAPDCCAALICAMRS